MVDETRIMERGPAVEDIWKSFSTATQSDSNGSFIVGLGLVCRGHRYCSLSGMQWAFLANKRPVLPKLCFHFVFIIAIYWRAWLLWNM